MWKGVLFVLVSGAIIVMGLYSVTRMPYTVKSQMEPMPLEINYDERVKKENAGIPSYLQIPSLSLYADIEGVKIDTDKQLVKPKNILNLGWYASENQKLGQKGVVILAGEFDQENGRPGSFYYLSALEKNDMIEVSDLNGKRYRYTVIDKNLYAWDSTDVSSLLIKSQTPKLNLIIYPAHTEENRKLDASRTIIYAEMK